MVTCLPNAHCVLCGSKFICFCAHVFRCTIIHSVARKKSPTVCVRAIVTHSRAFAIAFSAQVPEAGGRIQVKAQIALFARTFVRDGAKAPYTREDVGVKVEYFTDIDPCGWAPPAVVGAIARREIPRTLKVSVNDRGPSNLNITCTHTHTHTHTHNGNTRYIDTFYRHVI